MFCDLTYMYYINILISEDTIDDSIKQIIVSIVKNIGEISQSSIMIQEYVDAATYSTFILKKMLLYYPQ